MIAVWDGCEALKTIRRQDVTGNASRTKLIAWVENAAARDLDLLEANSTEPNVAIDNG